MLEIESIHIKELNDSILRNLIGLLCEEELKKFHTNVRNVFWGGHQDAGDGGIDVRCEYEGNVDNNSFIPRNIVGFQVKLMDLSHSKIIKEMNDKSGNLKESIQDLCRKKGAYILVCGRSSVSDKMYKNRIAAMKEAVYGYQGAESVCLDFMDCNRIATWVRSYPALIVWVREKINRTMQGWRAYGRWSDTQNKHYKDYIVDQEKRIYDYINNEEITVLEGIQRFRNLISKGSAIIRLTGLSGVGKTRIVEALFDEQVGVDALSPLKVIYADAAENLEPSAEQMLREVMLKNDETVLIMDNCSAELHVRLMTICRTQETKVSLITIEYDVKDENTEETTSFMLKPASDNAIEEIIIKNYTQIPFYVVNRIIEISGGNARLALLFAKCLSEYRDITMLRDSELFKRLFWQKGNEDKKLFKTAKTFSLLYSVDYDDEGKESELNKLSKLLGIHLRKSVEYLEELRSRDILQTRGKWCAILPHALSNYLAKNAIQSYRKNALKKSIIDNGTDRMKMSFAHRLSFLYDDGIVMEIAEQWIDEEFTDLSSLRPCQMECFYYLSKIKPKKVIECIKRDWNRLPSYLDSSGRIYAIVSTLAYYPDYFVDCINLLTTKEFYTGKESDIEMHFQYMDFMNKKCADERLKLIKKWVEGDKKELGLKCLQMTLVKGYGTGLVYREFPDFNQVLKENAKENKDYWFDVFSGCIEELAMDKSLLSILNTKDSAIRIFELIEQGYISNAEKIAKKIRKGMFWREGYIAIRNKLHLKSKYSNYILIKMQEIEELLKPKNLEEEVLYWCVSYISELFFISEYSFEEANKIHSEKLMYYGKILAKDISLFNKVYKELVLANAATFQLGKELAKSSYCNLMWNMLCETLKENEYIPGRLNMLMGILSGQNNIDDIKEKLGVLLQDFELNRTYVELVVTGNYFADEIVRFYNVVKNRKLDISIFSRLSECQCFLNLSIENFMYYMHEFVKYENCHAVIWDLIASKVRYEKKTKGNVDEEDKKRILTFLSSESISICCTSQKSMVDIPNYIKTVILSLCNHMNAQSEQYIIMFYKWIKDDIERKYTINYDFYMILGELYKVQPILFLNIFVENSSNWSNICRIIKKNNRIGKDILSQNHLDVLITWCNTQPDKRYDKIFNFIYGYERVEGKYLWKKITLTAMEQVENRKVLALKLIESINPVFTDTKWSKEREQREILFDLFEKDKDGEIVELAKKKKKKYCENTERYRKEEREYEKNLQRFE